MIDFACKRFDLKDIIKCGLGLTKSEFLLFELFTKSKEKEYTANLISERLNLDLTTIQKGVKKLYEKQIILRHQKNLSNGGYIYTYECNSRQKIREILKGVIKNWSDKVSSELDKW